MDDLGHPSRLFDTECEPIGRKGVINYFNVCWIELIKTASEDELTAI